MTELMYERPAVWPRGRQVGPVLGGAQGTVSSWVDFWSDAVVQFAKKACRARDELVDVSRRYPAAWDLFDRVRASRGEAGVGGLRSWPDWCFMPSVAAYAAVCEQHGLAKLGPDDLDILGDVPVLAALGAWRNTQGIYRFDPAVYEALVATPVTGALPAQVLLRLPEWCVYVETPGLTFGEGGAVSGFFAHLDWDPSTQRTELRLLVDCEGGMVPLPLVLGSGSLEEAIDDFVRGAAAQAHEAGLAHGLNGQALQRVASLARCVEPMVSLLLYLCSTAAEIDKAGVRPQNPEPKRVKGGWRLFAAQKVTTWPVGVRLGASLRQALENRAAGEGAGDGGGGHSAAAAPRAHIRRAHWHGFWSGPQDPAKGPRVFDLRWMPPIPVNVADVDGLPAVVRGVA